MSQDVLQQKRLDALCRHIDNVRLKCQILGERLIEQGEAMGHKLIANGYIHDNSKFYGVEWKYIHADMMGGVHNESLADAILEHHSKNKHHPEYWQGISDMPSVYVAEMVCDWAARSSEMGNDLREWIKDHATKKFKMKVQSKIYKEIKKFVDILLDPKFN